MTDGKAVEKLARRICWLGFASPHKTMKDTKEAAYWQSLPEPTREKYREEARWLCWVIDKIDKAPGGFGWRLVDGAVRERKRIKPIAVFGGSRAPAVRALARHKPHPTTPQG
jgi:hypothetical protein